MRPLARGGSLDEHEPRRRMLARLERRHDPGRLQSGQVQKKTRVLRQDSPVRARIGDEQEERFGRVVPSLQIDMPNERLNVTKPHLELDGRPGATSEQHRVPCPLFEAVLDAREWDFKSVPQGRRYWRQESKQPGRLAGVADGRASGIDAQRRRQAERCGDAIDLVDGEPGRVTAFDPPVVHPGHVASLGDMILALVELEPALAKLLSDLAPLPLGKPCRAVECSCRRSHAGSVAARDWRGLICHFGAN